MLCDNIYQTCDSCGNALRRLAVLGVNIDTVRMPDTWHRASDHCDVYRAYDHGISGCPSYFNAFKITIAVTPLKTKRPAPST